jgi:hypothetical protein
VPKGVFCLADILSTVAHLNRGGPLFFWAGQAVVTRGRAKRGIEFLLCLISRPGKSAYSAHSRAMPDTFTRNPASQVILSPAFNGEAHASFRVTTRTFSRPGQP